MMYRSEGKFALKNRIGRAWWKHDGGALLGRRYQKREARRELRRDERVVIKQQLEAE